MADENCKEVPKDKFPNGNAGADVSGFKRCRKSGAMISLHPSGSTLRSQIKALEGQLEESHTMFAALFSVMNPEQQEQLVKALPKLQKLVAEKGKKGKK